MKRSRFVKRFFKPFAIAAEDTSGSSSNHDFTVTPYPLVSFMAGSLPRTMPSSRPVIVAEETHSSDSASQFSGSFLASSESSREPSLAPSGPRNRETILPPYSKTLTLTEIPNYEAQPRSDTVQAGQAYPSGSTRSPFQQSIPSSGYARRDGLTRAEVGFTGDISMCKLPPFPAREDTLTISSLAAGRDISITANAITDGMLMLFEIITGQAHPSPSRFSLFIIPVPLFPSP
jgi:hypothetical protein